MRRPYAMHGDGAKHAERSLFVGDARRNAAGQVGGYRCELGVAGERMTDAGDSVSRREPMGRRTNLDNNAG